MGLFDQIWDAIFRAKEGIHVDVRHKDFAGGAKCDGITDDTLAIRAAEAYRATIPGALLFFANGPAGYLVSDTIDFDASHTHIRFASEYGSRVIFAPTTPKTLFRFGNGSITSPRIENVRIDNFSAVGGSVQKKVAIETMDVVRVLIDHTNIYAWTSAGSIGLRLAGRDTITVKKAYIDGDIPISLASSPVLSGAGPDVLHIQDAQLKGQDRTKGCITVEDNISLSSVLIDGITTFITDGHGFYAPALMPSAQLKIAGIVRDEHGDGLDPNPAAHTVYIKPATPGNKSFENVVLESQLYGAATKQGPYLEGVASVIIDDLWRGGADPAYEIVQPCNFLTVRHVIGVPPVIAGMSRVESIPTWGINSALGPLNATYIRANDTNSKAGAFKQTFSVKEWSPQQTTLAPHAGDTVFITLDPIALTGSFMCGQVEISYWSDDFTLRGHGIFGIDGTGADLLTTPVGGIGLFAAGKLGINWVSRSDIRVQSDLAQTVNVMIKCSFHDAR